MTETEQESADTQAQQEIGHEIGEHNIEVMGLDIHNPVFIVSAIFSVLLVSGALIFREQATEIFQNMRVRKMQSTLFPGW